MAIGIAYRLFTFKIKVDQSILQTLYDVSTMFLTPYLDYVHGSHSQASAVHHATNVTVEGDVIEVVVCRLHL